MHWVFGVAAAGVAVATATSTPAIEQRENLAPIQTPGVLGYRLADYADRLLTLALSRRRLGSRQTTRRHTSETRDQILITAGELADLIGADTPLSILDVRWRLDEPDGRAAYLDGHLPGAVYVSLDDELSDHAVVGRGRHPLPSAPGLEAAARRWGVRQDSAIVVYDDWNRAGSARAWWVLTAAGLPNVRILDGGLGAWRSAGLPLETGKSPRSRGM